MKQKQLTIRVLFPVLLSLVMFMQGCDPFAGDGITNPANVKTKGYFYITERESNSVIMLNYNMAEIKRWSCNTIGPDTSIQSITFDGKYLWLSFSGSQDKIVQVNAEEDTLVVLKQFDAPPTKQGTIRGLAFDGTNLWAVNSGSVTYSFPPTLYKLDASTGTILTSYVLPSPEPRGLGFVNPTPDVYGRGAAKGIYYTDVTKKKIYIFSFDKFQIDTAFSAPKPPMGIYNIYPTGITSDGTNFYLINSSDAADHLYRLDYTGKELSRNDFTYQYPQSIVWTTYDVRDGGPPLIGSITPSKSAKGTGLAAEVSGSGFKKGLTIDFGSGILADTLIVVSPNQLHLHLKIDSTAAVGFRDVTVTNPNGSKTTATGAFEVTAAPVEEYIYWLDQNYSRIYQIKVTDSSSVAYWSTRSISSGSPQGIAYDGTDLWITCSGTDKSIYKVTLPAGDTNAARGTGNTVFPMPQYASTLRGLTYANGFFWQAASGGKIYRVDPSSGAVLDSVLFISSEPRGVSFIGNLLYTVDNTGKTLNEYTFSTSTWRTAFTIPSPAGSQFPTGLSYDGSNFWIANSTTNNDFVVKLSPAGTLLRYLNVRTASGLLYDPSVTGILYLAK